MPESSLVVPCGKRKVWDADPFAGPCPAGRAYTGSLALQARRYAEVSGRPWFVLSARWGLLHPEALVPGPYDTTFSRPSSDLVTVATLQQQAEAWGLVRCTVLAGSGYVDAMRQALGAPAVLAPLQGCRGLGWMLALLKSAREERRVL